MNIFITLLENVNKSRTSGNNLSLNVTTKLHFALNDKAKYTHFEKVAIVLFQFTVKAAIPALVA
jgi:hypothetical protein